ncbi:Sodium/calcium exchanger protein-domain-containing protein [Chytriomyces cf. hyalinus JEL632]|nr:Sodium/calcium exchanger protein-domain-containing protein [Chytriomyces cf. hyalinus JEL632]
MSSECELIFNSTTTASEACLFALSHCSDTGASVNYMAMYTCVFGGAEAMTLGALSGVVVLVGLLLSCFVSVAAVAGGFLCANLSSMAGLLQLSETVAGVTLAALGNGAPDIFATYSAVRAGAGSMALGELLGAALFVTLVVVGGVALVSPDTALPRRPFLRDLIFLIGCVAIVLYITFTGEISFSLSIFFIVYYFAYVATVVVSHFLHNHSSSPSEASGFAGGHGAVADVHETDQLDFEIQHTTARETLAHPLQVSPNEDDFYSIDSPFSTTTFETNQSLTRIRGASNFVPHLNKELFPFLADYSKPDNEDEDDADDEENQGSANASLQNGDSPVRASSPSSAANRHPLAQYSRSLLHRFLSKLDKKRPLMRALRHTIVPYLAKWDSMSFRDRAFSLWSTPIGCCLKLTIPVVHRADVERVRLLEGSRDGDGMNRLEGGELAPLLDRSEDEELTQQPATSPTSADGGGSSPVEGAPRHVNVRSRVLMTESDRYLVAMQLFFGSQFAGSKFMETGDHGKNSIIWVSSCALGSLFAFTSFITSKNLSMPTMMRYHMLCLFGFIISILWVYTIANEVVGLLNTLGIILHIDEVILGLTIFAIGNCTGDLMTNLSIARMGYPKMALGACFGSPMMNFLLGLGISTLSISANLDGGVYKFETGPILRKSTIYLLASLVMTLSLIAASGFKTNAQIGQILLAEYVAIVVFILLG